MKPLRRTIFQRGWRTGPASAPRGCLSSPIPESETPRYFRSESLRPSGRQPRSETFHSGKRAVSGSDSRASPEPRGILIALTDHFSPPFDQEDHLYSLYNLAIDEEGKLGGRTRLQSDRSYNLTLEWDDKRRRCTVRLDKKEVTVLPLRKETLGANYLRIRSTAEDIDEAEILIESVEIDVSKAW